jgi:hypothetical protein
MAAPDKTYEGLRQMENKGKKQMDKQKEKFEKTKFTKEHANEKEFLWRCSNA